MTTLTVDRIRMPAADLGPENPLPHFRHPNPSSQVKVDHSVPESDRAYLGWETSFRVLPYRMQDAYGRKLRPREFAAIMLENELVKAVVLPEIGGRLASLVHKPSGIELLEPVKHFQPANVALRNAWIAGGVEWNTPLPGHHYLTCGPMFAARVTGSQGEPVLRLYARERVKQFPYQIDLHLPPGSEFAFAHVRIINPHDCEIPMYWWTNIAVPETPDRRVIAPADSAIHNAPGALSCTMLPMLDGRDLTYPASMGRSREVFFRVEECDRPWIACVDGRGDGLVHASTSRLRGRKMFAWGSSRGGRRWQEHLLGPGRAYLELQGGLARTQLESVPMPARTEWAWTEAFGLMRVDPKSAHSSDWAEARDSVEAALDAILPPAAMRELDARFAAVATREPDEILCFGETWGSLEMVRLSMARHAELVSGSARGEAGMRDRVQDDVAALPFPKQCLGPDQEPWLSLLKDGVLPERDVLDQPGHYVIQPEWETLLEESIRRADSDHWLGWLHLGVMRMEALDREGAREAWTRSIERRPSGWAYRNLSVLATRDGNVDAACDLMARAWEIGPRIAPLAIEYAGMLQRAGKWDDLRAFVDGLPKSIADHERMLIVSARLALHFDDLSRVEEILDHEFATIREGEVTLTDLWFAWQAKLISEREGVPVTDELNAQVRKELIPPPRIDMRMAG
jgi:hypothetical protein